MGLPLPQIFTSVDHLLPVLRKPVYTTSYPSDTQVQAINRGVQTQKASAVSFWAVGKGRRRRAGVG